MVQRLRNAFRHYSSKSALNTLIEQLACEEPSINCAAIRPGVVDTSMQQQIRDQGNEPWSAKQLFAGQDINRTTMYM